MHPSFDQARPTNTNRRSNESYTPRHVKGHRMSSEQVVLMLEDRLDYTTERMVYVPPGLTRPATKPEIQPEITPVTQANVKPDQFGTDTFPVIDSNALGPTPDQDLTPSTHQVFESDTDPATTWVAEYRRLRAEGRIKLRRWFCGIAFVLGLLAAAFVFRTTLFKGDLTPTKSPSPPVPENVVEDAAGQDSPASLTWSTPIIP